MLSGIQRRNLALVFEVAKGAPSTTITALERAPALYVRVGLWVGQNTNCLGKISVLSRVRESMALFVTHVGRVLASRHQPQRNNGDSVTMMHTCKQATAQNSISSLALSAAFEFCLAGAAALLTAY